VRGRECSKLIEKVAPGSMDPTKRKTNLKAKDIFNIMINHNAAIEAAREAVRLSLLCSGGRRSL
jgi:hypothetical protein